MKITIDVSDKLIKTAIINTLEGCIYEHYDSAVLKMAKVPKITALSKQIFADVKFQAELAKRVKAIADDAVDDMIYDEMFEIKLPGVAEVVLSCEAVYDQRREDIEAAEEVEEVERMVKALAKAGYKIVKE